MQKLSLPKRFVWGVFFFVTSGAFAQQTSDGALLVHNPQSRLVLLSPEQVKQSDRGKLRFAKPIDYSPAVISFYSLTGTKVCAQMLDLEAPVGAIELSALSECFGALPTGTYFYDLQPRPFSPAAPEADSLLFSDISDSHLPAEPTRASVAKFGDLNGDTFPDIVFSADLQPGQPQVLINDGSGQFTNETAQRMPVAMFSTSDIELFDVELDGDLDIFFAAEDTTSTVTESADRLFLNDGTGHFADVSPTHLPNLPALSNHSAWGLVNQDAFPDLVLTGFVSISPPFQSSLSVLTNDGAGHFVDQSQDYLPELAYGVFEIALADVNGDTRQDIVLANFEQTITGEGGPEPIFVYSGQNAILVQTDDNRFLDETATRMPSDNELSKGLKIVDIDNDNAPDLHIINLGFVAFRHHQLYRNDGTGIYEDVTASRLTQENITFLNDAVFRDYDGNGFVDIYLTNVMPGAPAPDLLNLNEGGYFSDASGRLPARPDFSVTATSADIEDDGDFDIFVSTGGGNLTAAPDKLLQNLIAVSSVSPGQPAGPQAFALSQNYPNPFNPSTTIEYSLAQPSFVTLAVYNTSGQRIRTLVRTVQPPGTHRKFWDGTDDHRRRVASGTYFYRLAVDGNIISKRMIFLK